MSDPAPDSTTVEVEVAVPDPTPEPTSDPTPVDPPEPTTNTVILDDQRGQKEWQEEHRRHHETLMEHVDSCVGESEGRITTHLDERLDKIEDTLRDKIAEIAEGIDSGESPEDETTPAPLTGDLVPTTIIPDLPEGATPDGKKQQHWLRRVGF
jgi:hypothetical protein